MQAVSLFSVPADDRLPEIHRLLLRHFGPQKAREPWDPLTQMIYSLLASRTKTADSDEAMRALRARYVSWEEMRDAPVEEIEKTIAGVTFAEVKAPRIKLALQQITARVGTLTLEFLARYRTEKIREWLEGFEGVGAQVSAAVVNFSTLRRRALCVDANHLRVTQRLKLTPRADAAITEERLMRLAPAEWDAAMLDEHHGLIKLLGQTICTFTEPRCEACPLLEVCPTGQAKIPTARGAGVRTLYNASRAPSAGRDQDLCRPSGGPLRLSCLCLAENRTKCSGKGVSQV